MKLTEPAKKYCVEALASMERDELVNMLEAIGVACYDEEDNTEFAESIADSVEAGDIEFDFSFAASKCYPYHVSMLWLDIDEVWQ